MRDRDEHRSTGEHSQQPFKTSSGGYTPGSTHDAAQRRHVATHSVRHKNDRKTNVLLIVGIAILAVALIGLGFIAWRYMSASATFDKISEENAVLEGTGVEDYSLNVDWDSLLQQNSDVVAWIAVPGTVVNYPVVKTTDNDYYLTHDFNKNTSSGGCVFLDTDNTTALTDRNTIIYGHNMLDGSMFASFTRFAETDYLAEHPYILLATPDGVTHRLKVCCVEVAEGTELLRQITFTDDAEFQEYLEAA